MERGRFASPSSSSRGLRGGAWVKSNVSIVKSRWMMRRSSPPPRTNRPEVIVITVDTTISRKFLLGGVASIGLAAATKSIGAAAQSAVVGAWKLESFDERVADGSFKPRFGPNPVGYLIYRTRRAARRRRRQTAMNPCTISWRMPAHMRSRARRFFITLKRASSPISSV